jgi:hypothetical protein
MVCQKWLLICLTFSVASASFLHDARAQTRVLGSELLPPASQGATLQPLLLESDLPRNFGAIHPPKTPLILPVGNFGAPNFLTRPWYVAPYRYYSYYRPWYTFGYYGPRYYPYHYAPSWGYPPLPFYAPPYLSPAAYGPRDYSGCYYW